MITEYYIQRTGREDDFMKERALSLYRNGSSCGQCIILAANEKYSLGIGDDVFRAMTMTQNGFGYGGMCAAAASAVMLFGIMFDENTAKAMRIEFLEDFKKKCRSFNCCVISGDCESIIAVAAQTAENIIERYR